MTSTFTLADFLFIRLRQLGVRSLHGVPGDYNLVALDYVEKSGLKWVGNCNELNAGYAADGYARVNGIGAVFTVIGVGELSAINACAGSYAENIPVVYLVGSPSRISHQNKAILHHTLGDGDFDIFANMFEKITVAQAKLMDINTAAQEIDRVLESCWRLKRPVYIRLPTDMATQKLDTAVLDVPLLLNLVSTTAEAESIVVEQILERLQKAESPVFLVDVNASRFWVLDEVDILIRKSGLPTYVTPMGKGSVDETLETFSGMYFGSFTNADAKKAVEDSDLILYIGPLKSDVNTAWFTTKLNQEMTIEFHSTHTDIGHERHDGVNMKGVLQKLGALIESSPPHSPRLRLTTTIIEVKNSPLDDRRADPILHEYLWKRLSSWFKPNDVIITENGTANIGIWNTSFPSGVRAINQTLWGSIGYSVGAAQGAAIALKDVKSESRTILFVGDGKYLSWLDEEDIQAYTVPGSFQLTVQELSTMIRHKLRITIFLIENDGYTIERFIHGMEAGYNDIGL